MCSIICQIRNGEISENLFWSVINCLLWKYRFLMNETIALLCFNTLFYISLPSGPCINTWCTVVDRERFSVFRRDHWVLKPPMTYRLRLIELTVCHSKWIGKEACSHAYKIQSTLYKFTTLYKTSSDFNVLRQSQKFLRGFEILLKRATTCLTAGIKNLQQSLRIYCGFVLHRQFIS